MLRQCVSYGLAVFLAIAVSCSVAQSPPTAVDKAEARLPQKNLREKMRENQKKLNAKIDFAGVDDPEATLGHLLTDLGKRYDVLFETNNGAFLSEGLLDVKASLLVYEEKTIPPFKGVTLEFVLRKILSRISAQSGATYLNRGECIEITTRRAVLSDVYLDPERSGRLPLIDADFSKKPLEEALRDLANQTGINIVLDSRTGEKTQTAVTAGFANVPLDTAVRILADMADLKPAMLDNVLYVTTPDNAKVLQDDYRRRRNYDKEMETEEGRDEQENRIPFSTAPRRRSDKENIDRGKEAALRAEKKAQAEAIRAKILRMQAQMDELQAELEKLNAK